MKEQFLQAATIFMGLFAVMNPLANTPLFLSLTASEDQPARKRIARNALLLTFVIIITFCAAGQLIFELFGISMPAFKITGGFLIFLVGFHMVQGAPSSVHQPSEEDQQDSKEVELSISVSPLAIPILAGPGTIATAMNFSSSGKMSDLIITSVCFLALCVLTYCSFVMGERLVRYLGKSAISALTRMMGMILAVIGVQMIIEGMTTLIKSTHW